MQQRRRPVDLPVAGSVARAVSVASAISKSLSIPESVALDLFDDRDGPAGVSPVPRR
jgi:hypothetical protein